MRSFSTSHFRGYADFSLTQANSHLFFNYAEFKGQAVFSDSYFRGRMEMMNVKFNGNVEFRHSFFFGQTRFNSSAASEGFNFEGAVFSGRKPEFSTFTKGANFQGTYTDAKLPGNEAMTDVK